MNVGGNRLAGNEALCALRPFFCLPVNSNTTATLKCLFSGLFFDSRLLILLHLTLIRELIFAILARSVQAEGLWRVILTVRVLSGGGLYGAAGLLVTGNTRPQCVLAVLWGEASKIPGAKKQSSANDVFPLICGQTRTSCYISYTARSSAPFLYFSI